MIKNNHQQHCSIVKTTFAQAFKKINKIKKGKILVYIFWLTSIGHYKGH